MLANAEMLVAFDPSTLFRKVDERNCHAGAVVAVDDRIDCDWMTVLATDPPVFPIHDAPFRAAIRRHVKGKLIRANSN